MAKDESLKSSNPSKKNKLGLEVEEPPAENTKDAVVKKKRRKAEVEEAREQIPEETATTADDTKRKKKEKKCKKKRGAEEAEVKEPEISDPPSRPQETREVPGEEVEKEEELSPEEKRVLERKMKKILKKEEKKRLRAEGEMAKREEESGPTAPQQALDYLTCWAEKRMQWKFQKTRQTWLLQHMFHSDKIPDESFSVLLEYLEGLRGGARDTTVQKALAVVEESGAAPEDETVQQRAHRAREVIQLLS